MLNKSLQEPRFDFISAEQKSFIISFDDQMRENGYDFGEEIGNGYCWGKYMLIYRKSGRKSDKVYARIYLREPKIVLRLFLNNINKHQKYIENSAPFIKEVFTGAHARCEHCHNEKDGHCRFRKSFTIDGLFYEKCSGSTFEFHDPTQEKIMQYMDLFKEFYGRKQINEFNMTQE